MELKNPYSAWMRGCWIAAGISVAVLLAAFVVAVAGGPTWLKNVAFVLALVAGSLLVLTLISLPIFYFVGRSGMKDIREMVVEGNHWAHWQYSQDEWQRFAEAEWTRTRGKARTVPFKILGGLVVVCALLSLTSKDLKLTDGLLVGAVLGVPIGILGGILTYVIGKSTYKKRLANVGEVYIGPKGVYQEGSYSGLKGYGLKLQKVEVQQGDPSVLHFEVRDSRGRSTTTTEIRVAVPRGQEQQATELVQRFQGEM